MKIFKKIAIFAIILTFVPLFWGCSSGSTSLIITAKPNKIVYEIGEKFDYSGLSVESYNSDGTNTKVLLKEDEISAVDTSTSGEKTVTITKGNLSTTFTIYVASKVVSSKDDIKPAITSSADGDIIYIKQGEYKPDSETDESLYNIVINKKLTIVGDGAKKTIIHGNFLVGARDEGGDFLPMESFEDFKLINVGMRLNYTVKDRYLSYEGPYQKYDVFGAIKTFDSQKIFVSNCSFSGYSYAINATNISGLTLVNNMFRDIKINAVKVTNSIKNSVMTKNSFMDIGSSSLVMENSKQGNVGALFLSFKDSGNAGIIVASNTFVRTGLISGSLNYVSSGADELELDNKNSLTSGSYVNNSAIIFLVSTGQNNLDASGIIFASNNFGTALKNIAFNTTQENFINQTGVIIIEG